MIRLDTIHLYADADILRNMNADHFIREIQQNTKNDNYSKCNMVSKSIGIPGLNQIVHDELNNQLRIKLSAKILGPDYFNLININTIDQVADTINRSGIIEIDKSKIDQLYLNSLDVTNNLNCGYTPDQVIQALNTISNHRYIIDPYQDKNNCTGIVFRGRVKTYKERQIIYDKHTEIKNDQKLLKTIPDQNQFLQRFENISRVECNITSHKRIRQIFRTDNNLVNVLNSESTPNYQLFEKIKKNNGFQSELFELSESQKLYEIEKLYGRIYIAEQLNYDIKLIRIFLRKHLTAKNISRYVREYTEVINHIKVKNGFNPEVIQAIICSFENQLKISA